MSRYIRNIKLDWLFGKESPIENYIISVMNNADYLYFSNISNTNIVFIKFKYYEYLLGLGIDREDIKTITKLVLEKNLNKEINFVLYT